MVGLGVDDTRYRVADGFSIPNHGFGKWLAGLGKFGQKRNTGDGADGEWFVSFLLAVRRRSFPPWDAAVTT